MNFVLFEPIYEPENRIGFFDLKKFAEHFHDVQKIQAACIFFRDNKTVIG
jgi:hypothetical protein